MSLNLLTLTQHDIQICCLSQFIYHTINFADEEDVEEETRKHKNLYFGRKSKVSRSTKREPISNDALDADDADMLDKEDKISTTNFLFSNDIDIDSDSKDANYYDETIN